MVGYGLRSQPVTAARSRTKPARSTIFLFFIFIERKMCWHRCQREKSMKTQLNYNAGSGCPDTACYASSVPEVMCENCAGGGSRWERIPSTAKYEMQRIVEDSGSGKGHWVRCATCGGKGFISQHNVQVMATPLAGANVERGVGVVIKKIIANKGASGGCHPRLVLRPKFLLKRSQ
jgi:hypothetical protein